MVHTMAAGSSPTCQMGPRWIKAMDICDAASKSDEEWVAIKVREARRELDRPSATHCDDCGEEIPEARRALVPWSRTCVRCQTEREAE